jgi:HEPN domain-containing protein
VSSKEIISIWIKLALSDLKSSRILYSQKQYGTSYFLFQQATEKANKAHALKFKFIKEEDLEDIRHDQFKIDRRYNVKKIEELRKLILLNNGVSPKLYAKINSLTKSISHIDRLRNMDLINISNRNLNYLYKEINIMEIPFDIQFPEIKEIFKTRNKELKKGYSYGLSLLLYMQDFSFIYFSIKVCALLTIKYSSLTRYPENGLNPLKIYTSKLPLIKKQFLFMNLLEQAIHKLNKLDEPKFPKI